MLFRAFLVALVLVIGLCVFAQVKVVLNPMIESHNQTLVTYAGIMNASEAPN
jgi:hypothetical protein